MKRIIATLSLAACILIGAGCNANKAPATPGAPAGPIVGMVGDSLSYLVATADPESDSVRYRVDWGDALGDWSRFFASAESCTVGHTWLVRDTYAVKVQAEDAHGKASYWSPASVVSIESLCRR
ncbi:hypothetical protein FJY68_10400 [candidate division WOR-3 bacterium]|uniref:Fibronectin type III domain-containing protein n=1 Tax=candidate division WOR-3 bacterium TaxID=2052148 RepID=A0A937XF31_UNCW3|nr:hypothetical protein [candidate division WOR-3 bacterium]